MRRILLAMMITVGPALAFAQEANVPDVVGTWTGAWRTVIFGHNPHHPGSETTADGPRIREIAFTLAFEGQDGRLVWGHSWSDPAKKEPFAATITADGKRIVGSDLDGSLDIAIVSADTMDACYTNTALGPFGAIVASCGTIERAK
jgi:hypothetical protein